MSKFKPCPFCGCRVPPAVQGNGIGDNWLECTECGASTRLREDGAGSEKDWNRRAAHATAPSDAQDAVRYRWLRDVSVPPHNFYMSVPEEFKDVKYSKADVDCEIDKAIAAIAPRGKT